MIELKETESTNSYVLEHADELREWEIVMAETQSSDNGGEIYPVGGLWMSVLLMEEQGLRTVLTGALAVADVLIYAGLSPCLKWPNEVLVHEKRIASIRLDKKGDIAALGIYINSNFHAAELGENTHSSTTLLDELGMEKDLYMLAEAILQSLKRIMERSDALPLWRFLSCNLGKRVRVEDGEVLEGVAEDIDDEGALLLRTDAGLKRLSSGRCTPL